MVSEDCSMMPNPSPQQTTEKKVALWVRVSHEDQVKGESPEHHEYRGRMYAEAKGWTVVKVFRLDAVSGKTVMDRPETKEMMRDIAAGRFSGLIFSKLARLARNARELLDFADYFREHGADLISLGESIDTSTPHGRFFYTNLAALAQLEREELSSRVAASVPVRARLGKSLGGAAPFGFAWVNGKLALDEKEAPVRRLMYELFMEVRRVKTVANILNERGYRTRSGARFTHTSVYRLLLDPTAKGERRANYAKSLGDGKAWVLKPESDWVIVPVPPIVPRELWEEVSRILVERHRTGKKPGPRPVHLFTGLVFCECGGKMAVPSNSPKWICPKCHRKIPVVDLERVFESQLQDFVLSPERIEAHLLEADQALSDKQALLESLTAEKASVTAEMDKVYRLYLEERISPEGFGDRYRPLEERAKALSFEIPRLEGEIDFLTIQKLSQGVVVQEAHDLYSRWGELSSADRRAVVETVVRNIRVGAEEVALELAYLPSSPKMLAESERILKDWPPRSKKSGPESAGGRGRAPR
jgi:site-specific DNA recombinase